MCWIVSTRVVKLFSNYLKSKNLESINTEEEATLQNKVFYVENMLTL